jgi:hypothetical protein
MNLVNALQSENKLVDVRGFEPMTPCLQSGKANLPNLAGAEPTRSKAASCDKTQQAVLLLFVRLPFAICGDLPRLSLRFHYGRGEAFSGSNQDGRCEGRTEPEAVTAIKPGSRIGLLAPALAHFVGTSRRVHARARKTAHHRWWKL